MRSFKEYSQTANTAQAEQTARQAQPQTDTQAKEQAATAEELTKKIAAAYNGKSNADMMRNILAEAEKSKRAGTLSNEEIENFYRTFSPMLDVIQRKKLRVIVDRLKKI